MNQFDEKLSEEQKRKLHDLHMIQQQELYDMIRRHQDEQMQIFASFKLNETQIKSKDLSRYGDKSNMMTYTPYTLSQYKLLKLQPILKNPGQGLGPTMSIQKWQESKDKMDRMLEFAEHVKVEHRQFKPKIPKNEQKEITVRQRGLEFAKNMLKPIIPNSIRKKSVQQNNYEDNDYELQQYELRNQMLKEQIGKMK